MKLLLVISLRITFWCFPLVMYILLVPFGMKNLKCGNRKKRVSQPRKPESASIVNYFFRLICAAKYKIKIIIINI